MKYVDSNVKVTYNLRGKKPGDLIRFVSPYFIPKLEYCKIPKTIKSWGIWGLGDLNLGIWEIAPISPKSPRNSIAIQIISKTQSTT